MSIEDPDADVLEQQLPVRADEDADLDDALEDLPVEADPADLAEQRRVVPEDEDETP